MEMGKFEMVEIYININNIKFICFFILYYFFVEILMIIIYLFFIILFKYYL